MTSQHSIAVTYTAPWQLIIITVCFIVLTEDAAKLGRGTTRLNLCGLTESYSVHKNTVKSRTRHFKHSWNITQIYNCQTEQKLLLTVFVQRPTFDFPGFSDLLGFVLLEFLRVLSPYYKKKQNRLSETMSSYLLKNYLFKVGSWEGGQEGGRGRERSFESHTLVQISNLSKTN